MNVKQKLGLGTGICIFMIAVSFIFTPAFETNDDVTMRSIVSGVFTGRTDGHIYFIQYPLAGILSILYSIAEYIPWFSLFFAVCIWYVMFVIGEQILTVFKGDNKTTNIIIVVATMSICFALFIPCFVYMQFTTIAGMLAGVAGILLILKGKKAVIVTIMVLVFMLRSEMFFASLPFVMAISLWGVVWDKEKAKTEIKRQIVIWGMVVVDVIGCTVINSVFYSSNEWQHFREDNIKRACLYDYTDIMSRGKYDDSYEELGLTKEQYEIISNYDILLDDEITPELLERTAEKINSMKENKYTIVEKFNVCFSLYLQRLLYIDLPHSHVLIMIYVLLAAIFFRKSEKLNILMLVCMIIGRSAIWMYLLWKERTPARVVWSLYYIEILVMLGILLCAIKKHKISIIKYVKSKKCMPILMSVILIYICSSQVMFLTFRMKNFKIRTESWQVMKEYCADRKDNIYLFDMASFSEYSEYQYQKDLENMIYMGSWLAYNPLTEVLLGRYNVSDCGELMVMNDNTYVVFDSKYDSDWLERYLQRRFGDCELVLTDTVAYGQDDTIYIYMVEYDLRRDPAKLGGV